MSPIQRISGTVNPCRSAFSIIIWEITLWLEYETISPMSCSTAEQASRLRHCASSECRPSSLVRSNSLSAPRSTASACARSQRQRCARARTDDSLALNTVCPLDRR